MILKRNKLFFFLIIIIGVYYNKIGNVDLHIFVDNRMLFISAFIYLVYLCYDLNKDILIAF